MVSRYIAWLLAFAFPASAAASVAPAAAPLNVPEIIAKNVAARGGLESWRKVDTMIWVGHIEQAHGAGPKMPFLLEMKRPNKTRFEITALNQRTIRAYDGTDGWKLRPARTGKPDVQPFAAEELKFARDAQGIDGPLIDYLAKGIAVTLEGIDEVDGQTAYRLGVKLPTGVSNHVWIDAQTFLEVKSDRESRNAMGQADTVFVYYRNYRAVDGLQIPMTLETGSDDARTRDRMVIDRAVLNPPLSDQAFAKPRVLSRHAVVAVEAEPAASAAQAMPAAWPASLPRLRRSPAGASGAKVGPPQ